MSGAPGWLEPLVQRATAVAPQELSPRAVPLPPGGVTTRDAAVLVLFGEGTEGPDLLFIERSAHLRNHAGQPAFPGGKIDPDDDGPVAAALREAQEETGLDPDGVAVLAELPALWVPPSGFRVVPVVAWWREPTEVAPVDVAEVAAVVRVPVAELAHPDNRTRVRGPSGYIGPAFDVRGMLIWGFTAGLVDRLLALGGWEQPWDTARVRELPESALRLAMRQRQRPSAG